VRVGRNDLDFVCVDANHCWNQWTGLSHANTLGKAVSEIWSEERCEPMIEKYRRAVETQQTLRRRPTTSAGEPVDLDALADRAVRSLRAITLRDISERKWLQQRLEEQIIRCGDVNMELESQQHELAAANARLGCWRRPTT